LPKIAQSQGAWHDNHWGFRFQGSAHIAPFLDAEEEARQEDKKPAQETPAAGTDSMEMREDRPPVATLRGDELGAWEDIRQIGRKAEACIGTT
jgi:hypothetical protein